jgi:hypothetical protein
LIGKSKRVRKIGKNCLEFLTSNVQKIMHFLNGSMMGEFVRDADAQKAKYPLSRIGAKDVERGSTKHTKLENAQGAGSVWR